MAEFRQFIKGIQEQGNDGKAFEVFCKWFLENDPYWSTQVETVWLWNNWPDKWGPDRGIDLVFIHKNGETWAVQAKCYDEKYSVTKKDMDTFLSESSRASIDHRLLMASTDDMSKNAIDTCVGQEKPVTLFLLKNFEEAKVEYPNNISELSSIKPIIKPLPDPHQERAIKDVITGFKSSSRGQLIMACGTGKTFTTLWIKEALEAETTLVLVPSLNLLSQTLREWVFGANTDFEVLCVCSDSSVSKSHNEDISSSDVPFPVTTDLVEVRKFLAKDINKVIFCTYHSSDLIAEVHKDVTLRPLDLIIADEAHRCVGKSDSTFSMVLNEQSIRSRKRIFTTATPRIFSTKLKENADDRGIEVFGMDDQEVFGPVFHILTFGDAIAQKLLANFQVVIVGVDLPMVKSWIDNQEIISVNNELVADARTLASKIGLLKAIKDYDLKRVISFHGRIKKASKFSSELNDIINFIEAENRPSGRFWSSHVSGNMKAVERIKEINKLKTLVNVDRGLLANARCLSEGVDVPSLDGVCFIDPKSSQVDIIQAVGRAIRKTRDSDVKKNGTIVVPIFIEDTEDPEIEIEKSKFKVVWDILKALRAHDELLAEFLDQYRFKLGLNEGNIKISIDDRIIIDLPNSVGTAFSEALKTKLIEKTTPNWEFFYGLLCLFKRENGHVRVANKSTFKGHNLGNWVRTQRHQKDLLMDDQINRLNDIGFSWDVNKEKWDEGYVLLQSYFEENGHSQVSFYEKHKGFSLGLWVYHQRNTRESLAEHQISKLEKVGFVWDAFEKRFTDGVNFLIKFKEEKGHLMVPDGFKYDGYALGAWVRRCRVRKDQLTEDKIRRLDEIGFIWDALKKRWDEGYNLLLTFFRENGHSNVPYSYEVNGYQLGHWVTQKRGRKNKLPSDQIEKLNALNFIWDTKEALWENGFNLLKEYKQEFGDCQVHQKYKVGEYNLGLWVAVQRRKKEMLSLDRIEKLDSIDFIWRVER